MMYEIIIFGDIHSDPVPTLAIINMLPDLKKEGYETLYWEAPAKESEHDFLDRITKTATLLKLFPGDTVPEESKRNEAQTKFIAHEIKTSEAKLEKVIESINKKIKFYKPFSDVIPHRKKLLEEAKKIGIKVVGIDVDNPTKHETEYGLESAGLRTRAMRNNIMEDLNKKGESSKSIVFVGFAHVADSWVVDTKDYKSCSYSQGILRLFLTYDKTVRPSCFLLFSRTDTDDYKKAKACLNMSSRSIMAKINMAQLEKNNLQEYNTLQRLTTIVSSVKEAKDINVTLYKVDISNFSKKQKNDVRQYIQDLGGKALPLEKKSKNTLLPFEINSIELAINDRRLFLNLTRIKIPLLHQKRLAELQREISTLTCEPCPSDDLNILLTFRLEEKSVDKINRSIVVAKRAGLNLIPAAVAIGFFRAFVERNLEEKAIIRKDESMPALTVPTNELKQALKQSLPLIKDFLM
jgi:hypothetical protein